MVEYLPVKETAAPKIIVSPSTFAIEGKEIAKDKINTEKNENDNSDLNYSFLIKTFSKKLIRGLFSLKITPF